MESRGDSHRPGAEPESERGPGDEGSALAPLAERLRRACLASNSRRLLWLAGSPAWTLRAAAAALRGLPDLEPFWLSDREVGYPRLPLRRGSDLLGGEVDCLIYDGWSGIDPDSLGAAVGGLRGGGILLLLSPPLARWPELPDPQAARIAVYPATADLPGRYLRRLVRVLAGSDGVVLHREGDAPQPPSPPRAPEAGALAPQPSGAPGPRTADQARALDLILATARGRTRRPLVIISDRGRGKTSVLGLAAAELIQSGTRRVLVTAPRRAAVEPLFAHAAARLPGVSIGRNRLASDRGTIEFLPPDQACRAESRADLLLVDEAAGIPAPLLRQALQVYSHLVFATTVHGYEGSGRGFEIRFRATLDELTPGWRELRLDEPVRWSAGDPLEAAITRALMLDARPAGEAVVADATAANTHCERLDRDQLAAEEDDLRALVGLLVLAHYQTSPMDLRHLLDGPNLRVYALRRESAAVATALVAIEGRLDPELSRAIFAGYRRPRGHLLPQTLSAHAGLAEAPGLGFARIVRIAVHPGVRRRGLARRLLDEITRDAVVDGLDVVGASFGADDDLLRFWAHCGLTPVHLGTSRNAASGAHAAVVLRPLSPAGARLVARAQARVGDRLPALLAGPLRALEPGIAATLFAAASARPALDAEELRELAAFASAQRSFEASLPLLVRLAGTRLGEALRQGVLSTIERDLVIAGVLQHRDWVESARLTGLSGRAEIIAGLRRAAARLLACRPADGTGPAPPER